MSTPIKFAALLVAAAFALTATPAQADERPNGTVLVIGDSITSRYNDNPASSSYGWWARTSYGLGVTPVLSAVGSTGMQVVADCAVQGTSFPQRLGVVAETRPDMIMVEGGRNDMYRCKDSRHRTRVTKSIAYAGIKAYMAALAVEVDNIGLTHSNVYVLTPWGTKDPGWRVIIQKYVRYLAAEQGFKYIPTAVLPNGSTNDKVHPNAKGNRAISNQVLAGVR